MSVPKRRQRKRIKFRFLHCSVALRDAYKRKGWWRVCVIASALAPLVGLIVTIPNPIVEWSKRTRAIIILSLSIAVLAFVLEAMYRHYRNRKERQKKRHRRTIDQLREAHNKQVEVVKAEKVEVEERFAYWQQDQEPKIELVFRHESPYEDCTHYGLYGKCREYYRIVRIGVQNKSTTQTLHSVKVTLKDFVSGHRSFNGVPFRRKDNWSPPYQETFSVNPGQEEYVDIAMRPDAHEKPNQPHGLILCHCRAPHIQDHFGNGPFYLTITVSASNAPEESGRFKLYTEKGPGGETAITFVRLIPFDEVGESDEYWRPRDQATYG